MPDPTPQETITPQKAVEASAKYYFAVVPKEEQMPLNFEEIEMSADKKYWLVTLSHKDPGPSVYTLYPGNDNKQYKVFTVDAHTGETISIKAKKL